MSNWFRKKSKRNRKELPNNAMVFSRNITGTKPINGKYADLNYFDNKDFKVSIINNTTTIK
jgi:hypothetical protein